MQKKSIGQLVISLFVCILIGGCATPYQPEGFRGGYKDSKISKDTFNVSFNGNAFIEGHTVKNYLLHRCAEVTLNNGFDYFTIISEYDSSGAFAVGSVSSSGMVSASSTPKPGYNAMIKCGHNPKPDGPMTFDAHELIQNIQVK